MWPAGPDNIALQLRVLLNEAKSLGALVFVYVLRLVANGWTTRSRISADFSHGCIGGCCTNPCSDTTRHYLGCTPFWAAVCGVPSALLVDPLTALDTHGWIIDLGKSRQASTACVLAVATEFYAMVSKNPSLALPEATVFAWKKVAGTGFADKRAAVRVRLCYDSEEILEELEPSSPWCWWTLDSHAAPSDRNARWQEVAARTVGQPLEVEREVRGEGKGAKGKCAKDPPRSDT